jgi:acyl-CoA reductase-like NAD-dependent aldehyde dehydrogenase
LRLGLRPLLELLVEATRGVRVGDPTDDATEMGPLISAGHRAAVGSFVEGSPFRGDAPTAASGSVHARRGGTTTGAREEVFGPVAA